MKTLHQASSYFLFFVGGLVIGTGVFVLWLLVNWNRYTVPNLSLGDEFIGFESRNVVESVVKKKINNLYRLELRYKDYSWRFKSEWADIDVDRLVDDIMQAGKDDGFVSVIIHAGDVKRAPFNLGVDVGSIVESVRSDVEVDGTVPVLEIKHGVVSVSNGSDGLVVDRDALVKDIRDAVLSGMSSVDVKTKVVHYKLNDDEIEKIKDIAKNIVGKSIDIKIDDKSVVLSDKEIASFINVNKSVGELGQVYKPKVREYVMGLRDIVEREPVDAKFQVKNDRVVEFVPDVYGVRISLDDSVDVIANAVYDSMKSDGDVVESEIPVEKIKPRVTTGEVNDLGIVERLGRGESFYRHSIPSRVYNVELAAKKIDGVLIAPGEEFSFVKAVGDISRATGFKSAYIIKNGRTVLGDGGGVCQVSTTVFRAALDAGFPITERWAHAYRVGYYEQNSKPGFDATIFSPSKDLKFRNDTGSYILIDSWYDHDSRRLVVDIYGKKDGREVEISDAKVWDVTPPPPPLYQDDPSLPKGVVKQVDWKAWGAKASFDYLVRKNGEVVFEKKFFSNYRPWQDVFLVGTRE